MQSVSSTTSSQDNPSYLQYGVVCWKLVIYLNGTNSTMVSQNTEYMELFNGGSRIQVNLYYLCVNGMEWHGF